MKKGEPRSPPDIISKISSLWEPDVVNRFHGAELAIRGRERLVNRRVADHAREMETVIAGPGRDEIGGVMSWGEEIFAQDERL